MVLVEQHFANNSGHSKLGFTLVCSFRCIWTSRISHRRTYRVAHCFRHCSRSTVRVRVQCTLVHVKLHTRINEYECVCVSAWHERKREGERNPLTSLVFWFWVTVSSLCFHFFTSVCLCSVCASCNCFMRNWNDRIEHTYTQLLRHNRCTRTSTSSTLRHSQSSNVSFCICKRKKCFHNFTHTISHHKLYSTRIQFIDKIRLRLLLSLITPNNIRSLRRAESNEKARNFHWNFGHRSEK